MRARRRVAGPALGAALLVSAALISLVGPAPVLDAEATAQQAQLTSHLTPKPTSALTSHMVLALGDSVPAGTACNCSSFPAEYASLLSKQTGAPVKVDNEAVNGLDTTGLLAQLRQPGLVAAVRQADVFLITIGANDFSDHHDLVVKGDCAVDTTRDCVDDELTAMRTNLAAVISEIRAQRAGRPTSVLVTGYWNVFEDGQVAQRAAGAAGLQASIQLTLRVNDAIRAVSSSAGADYVDIFAPFQRQGGDIDSLLAPDGDHPNATGHRLIGAELFRAGLPLLP